MSALEEAEGESREATYALADELKESFEESMPELEGVWADLLQSAFEDIDWLEIAEHLIEDNVENFEQDDPNKKEHEED